MADSFEPPVGADSSWVNMVRRRRTSPMLYFSNGFMEEVCEGVLDVIFNYGPGRRPQGLGWDVLIYILENIFEFYISLYVPLCVAMPLGGSKTGMESSIAKNTPSPINGARCVPFCLP